MATPTELQQLYLAYFGRPTDPGGMAFYANTPVSTVLQSFSASPESQALYGASFTPASVKAIYTYLFNRPAADAEAAFWVGVVNAPNSSVSPAAAALTILQSAHNSDLAGINDKLAVAAAFTAAIDTSVEKAAYAGSASAGLARQFIARVDAVSASIGPAVAQVDTVLKGMVAGLPFVPGPSLSATGAGPATFSGLANNATIFTSQSGNAATTLTASLQDGSGASDGLTINIANHSYLGAINEVPGLEVLRLVSNVTDNYVPGIGAVNATAPLLLSGSAGFTIYKPLACTYVDASGVTGGIVEISGNATLGTFIKGGSSSFGTGVTLGTGADTFIGGDGYDSIRLSLLEPFADTPTIANQPSGADVITTGGGIDTVVFCGNIAAGTGGATDYGAFATITDFAVGSDRLLFDRIASAFSLSPGNGTGAASTGLARGAVAQGLAGTSSLGGVVLVVQNEARDAAPAAAVKDMAFLKLTTPVPFTTDVKGTFAAAMGTGALSGLAANGNYLVSLYDTTSSKMVIAVANTGGNAIGDTTLAANDFTNADVAIVGTLNMTAAAYAAFGAAQLS